MFDYAISPSEAVRDAVQKMHDYGFPAICVVSDDGILLGLFSNGDMRRYFLGNGDLSLPITVAMNQNPVCFGSVLDIENARTTHPYIAYPLVDNNGHLLGMEFESEERLTRTNNLKDVPLVIMAGGKGTRLYPYTKILPKALVSIGEKTISENIIDQFYRHGCRQVVFILNHKAGMIRSYFDDLRPDYQVSFFQEDKPLGTGGGLSLLKGEIRSTFILSNCDILIRDDLACLFETHQKQRNDITFVCAMMNTSIPYGVIKTDESGGVESMEEKPSISYLVNTGVYVIEPHVLDLIDSQEEIGFPDIAKRCMDCGGRVGVFPVSENSWIDIGEMAKMENALRVIDGVGLA